jgi:polysaccharide chain length determinant protein (PEP-CTERM system associated)
MNEQEIDGRHARALSMRDGGVETHGVTGDFLAEGDDSFDWTTFRHYLHAPLRRPLMVIVPWAAVLLLSVLALLVVPKRYRSSTLILVESEKVPESFVAKVATENRSQRLEAISAEILSRTRLERVLEETQPYPEIPSKTRAVEKMRSAISVNMAGQDGFTIEFVHNDPHKAQLVTDRLATLFIGETIKAREQQVEGAVDFLVAQVADARKELEKKDETLRRYKEERMGTLPEQLQTNLATMQMLQRELQSVEESYLFAREKQESVAGRPGPSATAGPEASELVELQQNLALLRLRYTDEHPDVKNLMMRIAALQARSAQAPKAADQAGAESEASREQVERANLEVTRLEAKRADLEHRIAALRVRVEETPRTEQEMATLTRDYQKLNENYVALLSKQLEAQMAGRLEQRWKGDRFRSLDPASLPEKPYFPKPLPILAMGAAFGLFLGLGASLVAEFLDPTVKDIEGLRTLESLPIVGCIPHHPALGSRGR